MSDIITVNEYMKNVISSKKRFLITRTGWGAEPIISYGIVCKKPNFVREHIKDILEYNAGIYNQSDESLEKWAHLYYNAIKNSTCCFTWQDENVADLIKESQKLLTNGVTVMNARYLDPLKAVDIGKAPWTQSLRGKKVLIISPFTDSIKQQIDKGYNLVNGDNRLFHPDQEYVFYKTFNTLGGNFVHRSWHITFITMINEISKLNFDVALVSCGGYGLPICDFIYSIMKKSSIYVGGVLPLLFGVTCQRYSDKEYNPGMIKPSKNEQVDVKSFYQMYGYQLNNEVENKCYW